MLKVSKKHRKNRSWSDPNLHKQLYINQIAGIRYVRGTDKSKDRKYLDKKKLDDIIKIYNDEIGFLNQEIGTMQFVVDNFGHKARSNSHEDCKSDECKIATEFFNDYVKTTVNYDNGISSNQVIPNINQELTAHLSLRKRVIQIVGMLNKLRSNDASFDIETYRTNLNYLIIPDLLKLLEENKINLISDIIILIDVTNSFKSISRRIGTTNSFDNLAKCSLPTLINQYKKLRNKYIDDILKINLILHNDNINYQMLNLDDVGQTTAKPELSRLNNKELIKIHKKLIKGYTISIKLKLDQIDVDNTNKIIDVYTKLNSV